MSTLDELSKEIHENACNNGFWDKERNTGEMLMLVVSEASEAMEADRIGKYSDWVDRLPPIMDNLPDEKFRKIFEQEVKGTFEDEMADVVIRVMDIMYSRGASLEWHIKQKMRYNKSRPHMHGKKY
jgi:NTP pyrophosphatase (non-canonical NTP hydrolase)